MCRHFCGFLFFFNFIDAAGWHCRMQLYSSTRGPRNSAFDSQIRPFTIFPILILAYWPRGDSAASSLFGGIPGGYGLGAHHLPYAILGRGGSAPGFGGHTPASAPPPSPYSHSSLGTLGVAATQAASLGK